MEILHRDCVKRAFALHNLKKENTLICFKLCICNFFKNEVLEMVYLSQKVTTHKSF